MNKLKIANLDYDKGAETLSDKEYDLLENCVSRNKTYKPKIGGRKGRDKLPFKMFSLDKIKTSEGMTGNYVISDKLDGVSCLVFEGKAFTRGNGVYGSDITKMVFPKIFKANLPSMYAVRGELVVRKSLLSDNFSNTRTMVSSFVNRNEYSECVEFVGHELISTTGNDVPPSEQLFRMRQWCKVVYHEGPKQISDSILEEFLTRRRKDSEYNVDGVVLSNEEMKRSAYNLKSNPKYSFAYKMNFRGIDTEVLNIEWNAGKTGILTPVIIVKPVVIDGVTIKRVTGHNFRFIKDNKIGINSVIEIIRSGQVIPHVLNVRTTSDSINLTTDYVTDGVNAFVSLHDERVRVSSLLHFAKTLNIKGLGPAKAREFIKLHYTPLSIVRDGVFVDPVINLNLKTNITNALKKCSLEELLASTSALGHGMGIIKTRKLLESGAELPSHVYKLISDWHKNFKS